MQVIGRGQSVAKIYLIIHNEKEERITIIHELIELFFFFFFFLRHSLYLVGHIGVMLFSFLLVYVFTPRELQQYMSASRPLQSLYMLTVNLARLHIVTDILRATAINLATNRECGTQDLQNGSPQLLGQAARPHDARNVDDIVQRDRLGVLATLFLLAVTRRFLERLDDKRRCRRHHRHLGLTVLDGELDRHAETFLYIVLDDSINHPLIIDTHPVTSALGNIFTNLLGRKTKRTDLWGQSRLGSDFTASCPEVAAKG